MRLDWIRQTLNMGDRSSCSGSSDEPDRRCQNGVSGDESANKSSRCHQTMTDRLFCRPFVEEVEKVAAASVSLIATCFHSGAIIESASLIELWKWKQFCIRYPELYHMSEPGALPSILDPK